MVLFIQQITIPMPNCFIILLPSISSLSLVFLICLSSFFPPTATLDNTVIDVFKKSDFYSINMLSITQPSSSDKSKQPTSGTVPSSQKKQFSKALINRIITLKDQSGAILLQKFSIDTILSNIEKHQIQIVELFSKYLKDGFNLLEFIRFFLNIIPHTHVENLYLTIGLIDLFREITLQTHKEKIVLKDITDFMCDKILKNNLSFNKIEAKFLPFNKFVTPNVERKLFLQIPPTIYGETNDKTHKLSQKAIKTDSSKHSRAIIKSQFSFDLKKVFILDSLSESISVYDENCVLTKRISPTLTKLKKEVIILSFAFSKRQYRIGAVLKDFSLKFWDHYNNFQYEKSISTTSLCQNIQTNIYFLEYFNTWITTDKTGTLYYWNLLEEKPDRHMKCKYNTGINDICEIASLNVIVVVQECKRASRLLTEAHEKMESSVLDATVVVYNFYNGHIITEIDLIGQRIPHTILYSETYQALFMCGLEKKIKIYQLHPRFMDASLKGQLIGHENLITSFTLVKETPMVISADDKGKVKIWDFRTFTCLQTIDFSDKTVITNLLDMIQIGKIGVFGSRVNYIDFEDKYQIIKKRNEVENIKIEWIDFDQNLMEMYVFANRTLRVIDLHNGRIKHMFSFKNSPNDDDITVFRYFSCLKKFVFGNTKGEIQIFNPKTCELQASLNQTHEGALSFIEFDELNKIYITAGYDSKILIHQSSDGTMLRQLKNNFNGKEITCMEVSVYHNLLIIGSNNCNSLYIWNYEYGKLIGEIKFKEDTPVSIQVINGYSLLLATTANHNVYLFKINLSSNDLDISLVDRLQIPQNLLNAYADLKLKGKGKTTQCQSCKIIMCCDNGDILQYDILQYMKKQAFKLHCKEKSNYNPYRQGKENFISELQKMKHTVFLLDLNQEKTVQKSIWREQESFNAQFTSICFSRLIKLQTTLNLTIGNQRRIKIWNQSHELLCDYNINYCLPYKWNFQPSSASLTTEKVYFGIKIIQSIVRKYESDISIGQAKNIEIKELFNYIQKVQSDKQMNNRTKMMTEPDDVFFSQREDKRQKDIMLLQNQYSRKDLNFELVKRFNFTEIGGPTLKELDNIKKMEMLQREWKIKQEKQEKEKQQLLKNIQTKAKKNEEKDHIQFLLIKHKKYQQKEALIENEKVAGLAKRLNAIQLKNPPSFDDRRMMTTFNKNFFRMPTKIDSQFKSSSTEKHLARCQSKSRIKNSFEQYYATKHSEGSEITELQSKDKYRFRDILTEMNGRVKNMKKHRYRREETKQLIQFQ